MARAASRPRLTPARALRLVSLLGVWVFITINAALHQKTGGGPEGCPTVDAFCPFGGLETLYKWAAEGTFLPRIFPSSLLLLAGTVLLALVLRRAFCGWICPLGAMQELFAGVGRRLGWRRSTQGSKLDAALRPLKYVVLVVIIAGTWLTGELVFRPYDPWAAWAHVPAGLGELHEEFLIGTLVLGLTLLGSVLVDRPWCRYLCPLGALLGGVSHLGATRVVRREETCRHCGACDRACPVDIPVEALSQVRTTECLSCAECVAVCPVPDTLQLRAGRRVLSPLTFGIATLGIFFGLILITQATGVWRARPVTMAEITGQGATLDAANIRGFMSLQQIAESYGVSAPEILRVLALPPDTDLSRQIRHLMPAAGREVDEVRQAVVQLLGQPGSSGGPTTPAPPSAAGGSGDGSGGAGEAQGLTGMTTLRQVEEQHQVPADWLLDKLGLPADTDRETPLRDLLRPREQEVQEVREAVEEYRRSGP